MVILREMKLKILKNLIHKTKIFLEFFRMNLSVKKMDIYYIRYIICINSLLEKILP